VASLGVGLDWLTQDPLQPPNHRGLFDAAAHRER
jgi:hypothetical protein